MGSDGTTGVLLNAEPPVDHVWNGIHRIERVGVMGMMTESAMKWMVVAACWMLVGGLQCGQAGAALLDGLMTPLEQRLAERGENVIVGNFYAPDRADAHGPIGMVGEHTHNKGEFMFTYRYMHMAMEGMRNGTNRLANSDVLQRFMATPTNMAMDMHMFMPMYGLTDTVTVMAMVPYSTKSMDHLTRPGGTFTTESNGVGDVQLFGLVRLYAIETPSIGSHRFHLNLGLNIPTGSITERGLTPQGTVRLPYPMQLGSGTVDFLPGITYQGSAGAVSWGAQFMYNARTGRNSEDYSLGNSWFLTGYGAYQWADWVSSSVRLNYQDWDNISGRDLALANPAMQMVPTVDPTLQGGRRLDVLVGFNLLFPEIMGLENRLGVEAGMPIYQRLNGPQLETDWVVYAGWQVVH